MSALSQFSKHVESLKKAESPNATSQTPANGQASEPDPWASTAASSPAPAKPPADPRQQKVIGIQRALQMAGYDPGPIDGGMGPKTIGAIKKLQQANGLPADGCLNQPTQAALAKEVNAKGAAALGAVADGMVAAGRAAYAATSTAAKTVADAVPAKAPPKPLTPDEEYILKAGGEAALKTYQEAKAGRADREREVAEANHVYKATGQVPKTKNSFALIEIKEGRVMSREERMDAMLQTQGKSESDLDDDDLKGIKVDPDYLTKQEFFDEVIARRKKHEEERSTWDKAKDVAKGAVKEVGSMAWDHAKQLVIPGYGLYKTAQALHEGYEQGGGGARGVYDAVNNVANPAYHTMVDVYETKEAVNRGDYEEAGRQGTRAAVDGAQTVMVAAGGAEKLAGGEAAAGTAARELPGGNPPALPPGETPAAPPAGEPVAGQPEPPISQEEIDAAFEKAKSGTGMELPGQDPKNAQRGLQNVKIKADQNKPIGHHDNMEFKGVEGAPPGKKLEVRRHSANPNAPEGSYSHDNPTTQINAGNKYRLPDGTYKDIKDMTPEEKAAAHIP
jgi:peptidoglycan hydrolase-like protein with peptidoglycan-binding domain